MTPLRDQPIRRKLMTIVLIVSAVALLASGVAFITYEQVMFREKMARDLSITAAIVGENSAAALSFNDTNSAADIMRSAEAEPHIVAACIYDRAGKLFAQYQRVRQDAFVRPPYQREGYRFEGDRLLLFRPILSGGEEVGTIFIESDLGEMRERMRHYIASGAMILLGSLVLIYALASRLQRMVWQPISHLAEVAGRVARDQNFSIRARKETRDELGQLIDQFNGMLGEIEKRDDALKQAHEELERRVAERTRELEVEIEQRRKAEEARRESEALYSSLVEHLPIAIYRKDVLGRFTFVNDAFSASCGKRGDELIGRTDFDITDASYAEKFRRDDEQVMLHCKNLSCEEKRVGPTGEAQDIQVFKVPVMASDGSVKGTQGCFFDITERRKMQEALAYERDLLRTLLDNSPDYIFFKDAESRFIRVSAALATRLDLEDAREIIGKTDFDLLKEPFARECLEDEARIIRTGKPLVAKIQKQVWVDGVESWVITTKVPYRDAGGKIIGTFGISKDITALKEAEQRLEQAHKQLLDSSRKAGMAEVATGVLHNVGNVLNSINVSTTLLVEKIRGSRVIGLGKAVAMMQAHKENLGPFLADDPKGRQLPEYLLHLSGHLAEEQSALLKEVGQLARHVEHIKEVVSMQQAYARVSGIREPLAPVELIEDALRINSAALVRHDVKVVREFSPVERVLVDRHKVLQILINLISNAKYAMDDSEEKLLRVRLHQGGPHTVTILVSDNGVGIARENLSRVFEHGYTTRKDGHGFGLHSSALAARELGGSLVARSDGEGHGATFVLELPTEKAAAHIETHQQTQTA